MLGYSRLIGLAKFVPIYDAAVEIVRLIEDPIENTCPESQSHLRCHEVTRIVYDEISERGLFVGDADRACVVDGDYATGCDHSWIALDEKVILDPYAVARVPMVQLVHVGYPLAEIGRAYRASPFPRTDVRHRYVTEALRSIRDRRSTKVTAATPGASS